MTSFEKFRKHWLWALVAFFITTVIAVTSAYFQYRTTQHELGGSLNATFHSMLLNNREARTIVVCMEDTTIDLTNLYVTPTFDNPAEYSLKDFSLSFDAECTNVHIVPTSFVDAHEYEKNEWIYKYKDNVLAAHDDTKKPFSHFVLTDTKGRCYIKTKASYDGATDAFRYNTDVWFIVEPNNKHLSFDDWKINCKKRIFEIVEDKFYDVYYYTHNNKPEYQFDVALGSSDNKTSNQLTKNESKNQDTYQESKTRPVESPQPTIQNTIPNNITVEKTEEHNSQEESSSSEPESIKIKGYTVLKYSSYTSLVLNLNNEFTPGGEYIFLFTNKDSLNHEYTTYNYVNGDTKSNSNEKQCTFYFSNDIDLSEISNLRFLQNSNVEDFVKIDSTSEYEIKNISEYEIICVIRYSYYTVSYRTLRGGETMQLRDIGKQPLLVFNTGVKNEVKTFLGFEIGDGSIDSLEYCYRVLCLVGFFLIYIGGFMVWLSFILLFFMQLTEESYQSAKMELVDNFNALKINHILHDREGFWVKLWFLFLSVCFFGFPIINFIVFCVL